MEGDFKLLDVVGDKASPRARKNVISVAVQFRNDLAIGYATITFNAPDPAGFVLPRIIKPHRAYCPTDKRLCDILSDFKEDSGNADTVERWLKNRYPFCRPGGCR